MAPSRAFALLLFALSTACRGGGDDGNPHTESPGTGSAVLADRARVLDDPSLERLTQVTLEGTLHFSSWSPLLEELAPDDVLIVGPSELTPHGALLKIESVTAEGAGLVVSTQPAKLDEAFRDLAIHLETVLDQPSGSTSTEGLPPPRGPAQIRQPLELSFPVRLTAGSDGNQLEINGSVSLDSSVDLNLDFNFTSFSLDELSLEFSARETFAAELAGHGQTSFNNTITVGTIWFTPITLLIPIPSPPGIVPVVLTPRVVLQAGFQGSIEGEVSASVLQRAGFTAGLGYKDGEFKGFSDDESQLDFEHPTYEAKASIRAFAGPRLDVLLYGAVGPFAGVQAFVEAGASLEGPPPCVVGALDAGLEAKVGVDFLASYETTLFHRRFPLSSFDSCSTDPEAPRPALTWARTYGRSESPGEHAKAVIEASDGTYLVVGNSGVFEEVEGFAAAIWALRLDPLGNVVWQHAFRRSAGIGLAQAAGEVPDGFLIAGTAGVLKIDSGGNVVWAKTYEADAPFEISSLTTQTDGSFVVAGRYGEESWAMQLDSRGNPLWSRRYGGTEFARVRTTQDGGFVFLGRTNDNAGDVYLVKADGEGSVQWTRSVDNRFDPTAGEGNGTLASPNDRGFDLQEKPAGGYVVVGETYGNFPLPEPGAGGYYASFVAELDAQGLLSGGVTVHRAPVSAQYGGARGVALLSGGSPLVVGRHAVEATDLLQNEDVLLIQSGSYTALGGPGNDAVYGGTLAGISQGMPLHATADGGAILALTTNSFATESDEFWLIKLNRAGSINFPQRVNVNGASFVNEHAVAVSGSGGATNVSITASEVTLPRETTDFRGVTQ